VQDIEAAIDDPTQIVFPLTTASRSATQQGLVNAHSSLVKFVG
jgi:hypothetical protein